MTLYGHPSNPNPFRDMHIYQGPEPSCSVRSQEILLRDYGIQISKEDLKNFATEQGWYSEAGTPLSAVGKLMDACGIPTRHSYDNSIDDIIEELSQGHRIMVSVDGKELKALDGSEEWENLNAVNNPNHTLIVSGVNINEDNPAESTVILTDPGTGQAYVEYNLDHFLNAWEDSNCYMVATDIPAPYQYDASNGRMELSSFSESEIPDSLPFENTFSQSWTTPGESHGWGPSDQPWASDNDYFINDDIIYPNNSYTDLSKEERSDDDTSGIGSTEDSNLPTTESDDGGTSEDDTTSSENEEDDVPSPSEDEDGDLGEEETNEEFEHNLDNCEEYTNAI